MMKSAEYLSRTFNTIDKKNEDEYLSALNAIFVRMIEWRKKSGKFDLRVFEKQVNVIKTVHKEFVTAKESESVVVDGDRLWRALYSVYIAPMRERLFEDELAQRRLNNKYKSSIFCSEGVQPQENCARSVAVFFCRNQQWRAVMSSDRMICCDGCERDGNCDLQDAEIADTCNMFDGEGRISLDRSQSYVRILA